MSCETPIGNVEHNNYGQDSTTIFWQSQYNNKHINTASLPMYTRARAWSRIDCYATCRGRITWNLAFHCKYHSGTKVPQHQLGFHEKNFIKVRVKEKLLAVTLTLCDEETMINWRDFHLRTEKPYQWIICIYMPPLASVAWHMGIIFLISFAALQNWDILANV